MSAAPDGVTGRSSWRAHLGFVAWVGALAAAAVLLSRLGSGMLAPSPLAPEEWGAWLAGRDPFVAVMALLRVGAVGLLWYLLAVTLLGAVARIGVAARLRAAARLVRMADLVTPIRLRRLLEGVFSASAVGLLTAGPIAVPLAMAQPPIPVVFDGASLPEADDAPLVPHLAPLPGVPTHDLDDVRDGVLDGDPSTGALQATGHVVVAGESFWSIASDVLSTSLGRRPTDTEVAPYWRLLVDANRTRLVDPDNPDLILPGQVFDVPSASAS